MNIKGLIDVLEEHDFDVEYAEQDTEIVIACPLCFAEEKKLYISAEHGGWICFRCDARGNLRSLLISVCELSPNDAIPLEISLSSGPRRAPGLSPMAPPPAISMDLPKGFIPLGPGLRHKFDASAVAYLEGRGVSLSLASGLGIGFCIGGYYKQRVIVPVYTQRALRTFVARSWLEKEEKKVLMPAGSQAERALFGYDLVHGHVHRTEVAELILVEGVFDAIGLWNAGFPDTLCTLGAHVTDLQRNLIKQLKPRSIILLRDDDEAGQKAVIKEAQALSEAMLNVKIADLQGADPGAAHPTDIYDAVKGAIAIDQHRGDEALKGVRHGQ